MQVITNIDSHRKQERAEFWLQKMTPQLTSIINKLGTIRTVFWCRQDSKVVPVQLTDIYYLSATTNGIVVHTKDQQLIYSVRLYQVKPQLNSDFLEASRSVIFNYHKIDHLELSANGMIDAYLKNGQQIQIARRKIKLLKERLGL